MPYTVQLTAAAKKDLRGVRHDMRGKLIAVMEALAYEPRPDGCEKLHGDERTYRVRVGVYRVVYEIYDDVLVVTIIHAKHRRGAYRGR